MSDNTRMSVEATRAVLQRYMEAEHEDVSMLAPDVVYRMMATGEETRTPQAVLELLHHFYHVVFDARAETKNLIVDEGLGVLEGVVVGRHIGEFAGVPGTGRQIEVPVVVVYELRNDQIVEARIYFEVPAFLAQVSAAA